MSAVNGVYETATALFIAACQEQGVVQRLARDPAAMTVPLAKSGHWAFQSGERNNWYTNQEIDIEALPAIGPVRFLGALANGLSGYANFGHSDYHVPKPANPDYLDGSCPGAEQHWSRTLLAATDENVQPFTEVYVDDNGKPVALRKGRGAAPTAYLLEAVKMGEGKKEMVYQPGTLAHLRAVEDETRLNRFAMEDHRLTMPPAGVVRPWSDVLGLTCMRLSPLAYNNPLFIQHEQHGQHVTVSQPYSAAHQLAQRIITS